MYSRVVVVKVLVYVEDEASRGTVGVGHLRQRVGRAVGDESSRRGPVVTGEKDELRLRAG